jgi:hypothetical protein
MPLLGSPRRPAFDEYTIKFTVGAIALCLPWVEVALTKGTINSISASYWYGGGFASRTIFVGLLFAIGSLVFAYNGDDELELVLGKLAALLAIGVAIFPCTCGTSYREIIPHAHYSCAITLFLVLAVFCVIFWLHARQKKTTEPEQAPRRMWVYVLCCLGFVAAIGLMVAYKVTQKEVFVLYAETVGLTSFGVSWLTASRALPFLTSVTQRKQLFFR